MKRGSASADGATLANKLSEGSLADHKGRIILVTGASRGIGRAAFEALVCAGAHVVATARSLTALEGFDSEAKSAGGEATLAACEMSSTQDIDQLSELIRDRFGRLDGLFGNAGILGPKQPVGDLPPAEFEAALAINLTANFRLLHRLDPLLKASPAGRALFVTSGVAWKRHAGWSPYAVSKAALEALVGVYAHEIEGTAVRANLISPGPIRTELRVKAWPDEDPDTVPLPEALAPAILTMLSPGFDRNGVILDFKTGQYARCQPPA
jgi:NAD(P)-dependent dehydrogenase (short-subunit alcohol dehydrogenase family)